ncbi:hypothetical protein [Umezawaea sp. NPDC059074]|uniref:hypothetical protein n=1 Tax=Umezawaea sp. NPDC059074 TaxID=3346716 RepID=UPI0036BD9B4A
MELELVVIGEVVVELDVVPVDELEVVDSVGMVVVPVVVVAPVDVVVTPVDVVDVVVVVVVVDSVGVLEVVDSVGVLQVVDSVGVVVSGQSSSGGTVSVSHSYQQVGSVVGWWGNPGGVQPP